MITQEQSKTDGICTSPNLACCSCIHEDGIMCKLDKVIVTSKENIPLTLIKSNITYPPVDSLFKKKPRLIKRTKRNAKKIKT